MIGDGGRRNLQNLCDPGLLDARCLGVVDKIDARLAEPRLIFKNSYNLLQVTQTLNYFTRNSYVFTASYHIATAIDRFTRQRDIIAVLNDSRPI